MMNMNRRDVLLTLAAGLSVAAFPTLAAAPLPEVQVYKNPYCGCCEGWVAHLRAAGFKVKVNEVEDTGPVRKRLGIPEAFGSCHTGLVQGYALEGHVPAPDILRLLKAKPVAAGLAVPGMPAGSPGMEAGNRHDRYEVLLIDKAGRSSVFATHG